MFCFVYSERHTRRPRTHAKSTQAGGGGQRTEENAAHAQLNYILEICAATGAMCKRNKAGTCLRIYTRLQEGQRWTKIIRPQKSLVFFPFINLW